MCALNIISPVWTCWSSTLPECSTSRSGSGSWLVGKAFRSVKLMRECATPAKRSLTSRDFKLQLVTLIKLLRRQRLDSGRRVFHSTTYCVYHDGRLSTILHGLVSQLAEALTGRALNVRSRNPLPANSVVPSRTYDRPKLEPRRAAFVGVGHIVSPNALVKRGGPFLAPTQDRADPPVSDIDYHTYVHENQLLHPFKQEWGGADQVSMYRPVVTLVVQLRRAT